MKPIRTKTKLGIQYTLNGNLHNDNGPAMVYFAGEQLFGLLCWYQNGKLHRTNGPAVIGADGEMYWYLNGKQVDPVFDYHLFSAEKKLYEHRTDQNSTR